MKQLIIGKSKAYSTVNTLNDATALADGVIGIYSLADNTVIKTAKAATNFLIALGREGKAPVIFPEVDVKTLSVVKSTYSAATTFKGTITVPTPVIGKEYTIIVVKKGVVFHERNTWTVTTVAKDTTAANVAEELIKQINASSETSGVKATKSGGAITITAVKAGTDYELKGADELTGVSVTAGTVGTPAILDKSFVQDLASRCAAGKGFNYLAEDGSELYPGYPEVVEDTQYVMYTLRFAVPRVAAKTRDEVASQVVYIVLPSAAGAVTTLDTVLGLATAQAGS